MTIRKEYRLSMGELKRAVVEYLETTDRIDGARDKMKFSNFEPNSLAADEDLALVVEVEQTKCPPK